MLASCAIKRALPTADALLAARMKHFGFLAAWQFYV
jgi:hypothetical protein